MGAINHEESRCENCIVRQFNAMKAVSKEDLKKMSDSKETKVIKKGETLFGEGEKLDGIFCVRDGVSKLSKLSPNGKDKIVKLAQKGELMGQRSVIAGETTNLSATAISDMHVCFIPKDRILQSLEANPDFGIDVLRYLAKELKQADDVIVDMSNKTVKQRIAETYLHLRDEFGEDQEGFLRLSLSREDLANWVGTATESAIRTISDLKEMGILKTSGKRVRISDEQKLRNLVNGLI